MSDNTKQLLFGIGRGDKRSINRAIALIENDSPQKNELLNALSPFAGNAYVIAITGARGTGKSSLTEKLLKEIRKVGLSIGVLAVFDAEKFSAGPLINDRLRMYVHALEREVYVRSLSIKGNKTDLTPVMRDAVNLLDAAGKDVIVIVSAGEFPQEDIIGIADTVVMVLAPGANIYLKENAVLLSRADIFVVNKGDLDGTEKMQKEIETMLLDKPDSSWHYPVICTSSLNNNGFMELWQSIYGHWQFIAANGVLLNNRVRRKGNKAFNDII